MDLAVKDDHVRLSPFNKNNLPLLKFWFCQESSYGFATEGRNPEDIILRQDKEKDNFFASGIYPAKGDICIGFVSGEFKILSDHVLWICSFFIDKRWQRKRYGTNAFQLLEKHSRRHYHIKQVFLSVSAENETGIAFWKSLGFYCVKELNTTGYLKKNGVFILEKRLLYNG